MKLNIVLINPNIFGDPNVPGSYRKAKIPTVNLGLGSLAAYIEKKSKHNVYIIDARTEGLDPKKAFEKIIKINPDIVGISLCSHESIAWTDPFVNLLKSWKPNIHITLGNHFASLFPKKALHQLPLADSIVIGEGEETFYNLITCISEKTDWRKIKSIAWKDDHHQIIINERRSFIKDLNTLPIPKRSTLKNDGVDCEMVIEGSRGCAFKCSFCTIGPFNGLHEGIVLRQRTAKSIFNEIKILCNNYSKLKRVRFVDPEFFIGKTSKNRIQELTKLLNDHPAELQICVESRASSIIKDIDSIKLLKSVGLIRINIGIESGSQKILNKMNKCTKVQDNIIATKILRDLKIDYSYGFMMITPWCLDQDIEDNASLLKNIGKIELHKFFHEMSIIPGTAVFEQMDQKQQLYWIGKLSYYTYKTASKRIERYRKLAAILESNYNDFFKKASFIYESIRSLIYGKEFELALAIEKKSDKLFLEIFYFCWKAAKIELRDDDYFSLANKCYDIFTNKLDLLLKTLDNNIPIPIPNDLLPKYSTKHQI